MNLLSLINLWLCIICQVTTKCTTVTKLNFFHQLNTPWRLSFCLVCSQLLAVRDAMYSIYITYWMATHRKAWLVRWLEWGYASSTSSRIYNLYSIRVCVGCTHTHGRPWRCMEPERRVLIDAAPAGPQGFLHAWLHACHFSSHLGNRAAALHACMHPVTMTLMQFSWAVRAPRRERA